MISLVLIEYTSNYSSLIGSCVCNYKAYRMNINTWLIALQLSLSNAQCVIVFVIMRTSILVLYKYQYKCESIPHCNYAYLPDMHIVVRLSMWVHTAYVFTHIIVRQCYMQFLYTFVYICEAVCWCATYYVGIYVGQCFDTSKLQIMLR